MIDRLKTVLSVAFLFIIGIGIASFFLVSKETITDTPSKGLDGVTVVMNVSAYCPCSKCCGKYADGITASGHRIKRGDRFIAADKRYPFGTKMYIPNYGMVRVKDRGGAIIGNHLDVFFPTHQEALNWGRKKYMKVRVYRETF